MIEDIRNKDLYAIVSVGYNRIKSQKRLLSSLLQADYSQYEEVPLIISIDCSGDLELYNFVNEFKWPFGEKYVFIRESRLGLKEHILSCGDFTKYFKGIILLEDDIYVAKDFYNYTIQMEKAYGDCPQVASISLYNNEMNGYCWLPLVRLKNESDVFAEQSVATWGEAWNERMWSEFRQWLSVTDIPWDKVDMPFQIKAWTKAWSKFFDAYLVLENKYSIYPYVSLTTNFSDAGEHGTANNTIVQVSLQQGKKEYNILPFDELVKYDIYSNNIGLTDVLSIPYSNICLDLYGIRNNDYNKKYYLSTQKLPYKICKSFGLYMRPHELNIFENIPGNDIFLYDTTEKGIAPNSGGRTNQILYFQHGFNFKYLPRLIWGTGKNLCSKVIKKYIR